LAQHLGERVGIAPTIDERLRELDFGAWEGQPWNAIDPNALNEWMSDFVHVPAGGGERFLDLIARVGAFIDALPHEAPDVIVVLCHAGTIKAALTHVLGADPAKGYHVRIDHGSLTTLHALPACTQWEVVRLNT
jgi:alpha-ribazole phosphatase